jgi:3-oxoacyl-[acyl-carrier protein] reductase
VGFAKAGADVAVHYSKNVDEAKTTGALIREAGRKAVLVRGNFLKSAEIESAMKEAVAGLGGSVDELVNNVGDLIQRVPFSNFETSLWDDVIALNLSSVFHAIRAVLPHFASGARIINVSSLSALNGAGKHAFAYAAAKGGMVSMNRSLANEFATLGIRVNCIAPGVVKTPFHDRFNTPEALETVRKSLPLQRLGTPDDIAGVALFLASPLSAYMTGEVVEANGGGRTWADAGSVKRPSGMIVMAARVYRAHLSTATRKQHDR